MKSLPYQQEQSLLLDAFWNRVAWGDKRYRSKLPARETLAILKKYADLGTGGLKRGRPANTRGRFHLVKGLRHSLRTHGSCFCCGYEAVARHHILPIKDGGQNAKRNLVSLCKRCHEFIHPWMRESSQVGARRRRKHDQEVQET